MVNSQNITDLYYKEKTEIRVLQVINSLNAGGAESLLKNFVIESKKHQVFNVEICVLYSSGIFKDEVKKAGIRVRHLNLSTKYDLRGIIRLINLIRQGKYDIVHVHLFPASIFVAITSLFLPNDIYYVFTEHSEYNRRRSLVIFKILDRFTYSRYNKIICIGNKVCTSLIEWLPRVKGKALVINNGVPIPELNKEILPKIYDVLFVGRLEKVKGIDFLLEAIAILKVKYNKFFKVALVGDGPLKEKLKELFKKLKIEDQVKFLGIQKDVGKFMRSSKIFVLQSRWEGFGLVIIEAMSNMVPVIASNVGGIPEIIKNGENGILVPPKDPEALAKAIKLLLDSPELQKRIAQNAYEKVKEKFSIGRYTIDLLNLYKKILGKHR